MDKLCTKLWWHVAISQKLKLNVWSLEKREWKCENIPLPKFAFPLHPLKGNCLSRNISLLFSLLSSINQKVSYLRQVSRLTLLLFFLTKLN